MDKKHLAEKVGLFVFVCLSLLAALLIMFSKGVTSFSKTYHLNLHTTDAGGIKGGANVLMAGYPIGDVESLKLAPDGFSVTILLKISSQYEIHSNALFVLEQAGFLGDQFVAVYPDADASAPLLLNGADVSCAPPFNLQATARDAGGFIQRLDKTVDNLNDAISDVRREVLNHETLTNLALTLHNLRSVSESALDTVHSLDEVIATNAPLLGISASNIVSFSSQISSFANELNGVLSTNNGSLSVSMNNIQAATESLKGFADDLHTGKGLVGALVKDQAIAMDFGTLMSNLSITSSNLNRHGIWGIMWSHKPTATNAPPVKP